MPKTTFNDLIKIMSRLRAPGGCPWDRKQTHESLLKYLREESKEVEHAVRKKDPVNLEEELGDVLLQILFHAQIAKDNGQFDIHDVLDTLKIKLTLRHPHVFGDKRGEKWTAEDVVDRWDEIKAREKKIRAEMRKKRRKR